MKGSYYMMVTRLVEYLNEKCHVNFAIDMASVPQKTKSYSANIVLDDGETIGLNLVFPERFPLELPEFYLHDNSKFRLHVGSDRKVCLFNKSAMLIDHRTPEMLLVDCYRQALHTLNIKPGCVEYKREAAKEFGLYLCARKNTFVDSCLCVNNIDYQFCTLLFWQKKYVLAQDINTAKIFVQDCLHVNEDEKDSHNQTCLVMRMKDNCDLPLLQNEYNWKYVRQYILKNATSSVRERFKKYISKPITRGGRYIFLIIPGEFKETLLGFYISFRNIRAKAIENSYLAVVTPIPVFRRDSEYLRLRGGASSMISEKSVLLLGCGSIGGFLANNLCQSGITSLDFLDSDTLQMDNIYRHYLGTEMVGMNKADALKKRLENAYPYVDIDALAFEDRSVEAFLDNKERLKSYSVIISALGEPTLNLYINRLLYENHIATPFVCCMNEPYGIGGHAIAVNIDQETCLQCLYTDVFSNDIVPFRGSLVQTGQDFHKYLSGCSGAYVPYGSLDSQQTAIITARLVLEILSGKVSENVVYSWIGPSNELESNGYTVSDRYKELQNRCFESIQHFGNQQCCICQGRLHVEA